MDRRTPNNRTVSLFQGVSLPDGAYNRVDDLHLRLHDHHTPCIAFQRSSYGYRGTWIIANASRAIVSRRCMHYWEHFEHSIWLLIIFCPLAKNSPGSKNPARFPNLPLNLQIPGSKVLPSKKQILPGLQFCPITWLLLLLGGLAPPKRPCFPRASPRGHPAMNFSEYEPCRTCTLEVFTIFGSENRGRVHYSLIWKPWKCFLLSDLETLEVFTIFGSENFGKCSLFSDLKTVEVFTIFGSENLGSVHYFRTWKLKNESLGFQVRK